MAYPPCITSMRSTGATRTVGLRQLDGCRNMATTVDGKLQHI
jgi:hypothetical protein